MFRCGFSQSAERIDVDGYTVEHAQMTGESSNISFEILILISRISLRGFASSAFLSLYPFRACAAGMQASAEEREERYTERYFMR